MASNHKGHVSSVAFSPCGTLLASGSEDKKICVWEVASGKLAHVLQGHKKGIWSVAFSHDGVRLLSGGKEPWVHIWDVKAEETIRKVHADEAYVSEAVFLRDSKRFVTAGRTSLRIWVTATGKMVQELEGHTLPVFSISVSPDARSIASGSDDSTVRVWDVRSGAPLLTITGHEGNVNSVSFSRDGRLLAAGGEDQIIRVWEVASGEEVFSFEKHKGPITSLAVSRDSAVVISASSDKTVLVSKLEPTGWRGKANSTSQEKLWSALFDEDARVSFQASWALSLTGSSAVEQAKATLRVKPKERMQINKLIRQLDHEEVTVREKAGAKLLECDSETAIQMALKETRSPEARDRMNKLLGAFQGPVAQSPAHLRRMRVVGLLERIGSDEARRVLSALSTADALAAVKRLETREAHE